MGWGAKSKFGKKNLHNAPEYTKSVENKGFFFF